MIAKLLFVLFIINSGQCARILGVFPAQGYSQFILCEKLMTEIALKGHDVTVISPHQPKHPLNNYKTISTHGLLEKFKDANNFSRLKLNSFSSIMTTYRTGLILTEYTLSHPNVQQLIHSNQTFDLVIVENFFCEALNAFSVHFKAPMIIFSSIGVSEWNNNLLGHPNLPSVMPISRLRLGSRMDLYERAENTLAFLFDATYKRFINFPQHQELINTYFPNSIDLEKVIYNASLLFLNSHFAITEPAPLVPGMVEIGGFHIAPKKLPKDIQQYLDSATEGAIYFSLGTNLKFSKVSPTTLKAIINVFTKLKQKILWKFDGDLPNLPNNILVSNWLPQQEILAHPNTKLFITHGGLLSTTEAVHFGVPLIGIPIFGDQKMNVAKAQKMGFALEVPFEDLNEDTLLAAIQHILDDSTFAKNVKDRAKLYHDQPVKPLDLALYWVEFLLRNKDSIQLMRFAGRDLKWYQYYLLDVVTIVLGLSIVIWYCLVILKKLLVKSKQNKYIKVKTK